MSGTPATPAMEYLGQLCFVQRKALRMTLDEVAKLAGTTKSYLWEIEHGQSMPSFLLVARLCEALELDIGALACSALRVARLAASNHESVPDTGISPPLLKSVPDSP